jgi:hypothetical protein
MTPATQNLSSVVEDDTWRGLVLSAVTVGGSQPASAAASAVMEFRKPGNHDSVELKLATGSGITINTAATYATTVAPRTPIGLKPGKYDYRIRFTDAAGGTYTYVKGTLEVLKA